MKLKGAAHAAADRRRVADSNVISRRIVFFNHSLCFTRDAKVPYGIRLGAGLWAAVESSLTMTLMFPDF